MPMPMFRPSQSLKQELFEPIYSIEMVRKWKLEKIKKRMNEKDNTECTERRKDEIRSGISQYPKLVNNNYNSNHIFDNWSDYNIIYTPWGIKKIKNIK